MSFSLSEYTKIDVGWGFAPIPKPHLGELTALPRPSIAGFKGAASRQEGSGGEESEGLGRGEREERGKGEWGREVIRGTPWLLG